MHIALVAIAPWSTCYYRVPLAVTGYNLLLYDTTCCYSLYHRVHRCTTVRLNYIWKAHCMKIGKASTACIAHGMPCTVAQITVSADLYLQRLLSCTLRLTL